MDESDPAALRCWSMTLFIRHAGAYNDLMKYSLSCGRAASFWAHSGFLFQCQLRLAGGGTTHSVMQIRLLTIVIFSPKKKKTMDTLNVIVITCQLKLIVGLSAFV